MSSRTLFLAFIFFVIPVQTSAKEFWWVYLASYDGMPGSTRLDMSLKRLAPFEEYSSVVVTGTTYEAKKEGLPDPADLERLNQLSFKVMAAIQAVSPSIYAGTFTHNSEQLHYVYVKDAASIKTVLEALYKTACPGCKTYINVKKDPSWSAYRDFLYPNKATRDFHRDELRKYGFVENEPKGLRIGEAND
jgi:hypothetical protein